MKVYEKPTFEYIEMRPEERLAASCIEYGSCYGETDGKCESQYYGPGPA